MRLYFQKKVKLESCKLVEEGYNNVCGPLAQLLCRLLEICQRQKSYGANGFPEGKPQLDRILEKHAVLADDPSICRNPEAALKIRELKK